MRATVIRVLVPLLIAAAALATEPSVETFPVPAGHLPTEIARHGDVMTFVSWKNWPSIEPYLGRVNTKGRIELQALAKDHMPGLIAQSPDGSLWLSDGKKSVLWHISPAGKAKQVAVGRTTLGIAVDADGSIWTTHPDSGEITRYSADGQPQSQWFIGRKRGPAGGAPTMAIPKPRMGPMPIPKKKTNERPLTKEERKKLTLDARPSWIVVGPDQALWFSEPTWRNIGRVTAAGQTSSFKYPREWGEPRRIVAGRDALWFALTRIPALGRITTEGEVSTVELPYGVGALASDSQGRIWFSDAPGARLGYLDAEGKVHELALPMVPRLIRSMAEGPDGAMWFADQAAKVIGRIKL
jgi:virginiamycin B lyase